MRETSRGAIGAYGHMVGREVRQVVGEGAPFTADKVEEEILAIVVQRPVEDDPAIVRRGLTVGKGRTVHLIEQDRHLAGFQVRGGERA